MQGPQLRKGHFSSRTCCRPIRLLNDAAMKIRDAVPEDAPAACQVMRRSIAELCAADHHDDPAILQRWLSNKTPEVFRSWIKPENALLVAVDDTDNDIL